MMRWIRQFGPLALLIALLLIGPLLTVDPLAIDPGNSLVSPNAAHPFGTDLFGRDMLARTVHGGRASVIGSAAACALAVCAAVGLRALIGRVWLRLVSRALLALPPLVLALVLLTLVRGGDAALIGVSGAVHVAGLLHALLSAEATARAMSHIEAARAIGASDGRIWRRHVLPVIAPTLAAQIGVTFAGVLLTRAALTYLGFGGDPSAPEWGRMVYDGRQVMRAAPWVALAPGAGLTVLVLLVSGAVSRAERWTAHRLG